MKKSISCIAAIAASMALLVGYSSQPSPSESASPTIVAPKRIVAITSETADMALLLACPDSMTAIAASSQSPSSGMVPDLAKKVTNTLAPGINPDAEQILSFQPDLVLTTARHGGEKTVNDQLAAAGVKMVEFQASDFNTPEAYTAALIKTGDAVGNPHKAKEESDKLLKAMKAIDAKKGSKSPSSLSLMARGGKVMAISSENMLPGLAIRAGSEDTAAVAGITSTRPIDTEQLLKINPEILFLEDFQGAGKAPFEALLNNPALADVPAIANNRVYVMPMTEASSLAGINLPIGYQKIMDIINQ